MSCIFYFLCVTSNFLAVRVYVYVLGSTCESLRGVMYARVFVYCESLAAIFSAFI